MGKIIKSICIALCFFIIQILGTIGIILWKSFNGSDWIDRILDSSTYLSALSEIVMPALILADIIILTPIVILSLKGKIKYLEGLVGGILI
jgi:hypothetical protein